MKRNVSGSFSLKKLLLFFMVTIFAGLLVAENLHERNPYFEARPSIRHISPVSIEVGWTLYPEFNKTTHYQVQLNHSLYGSSTKSTSQILTELSPGASYRVSVVTYDNGTAVGVSTFSSVLMAPATPQHINVFYIGSASVGISWQQVETATAYRIYQDPEELLQEITDGATRVMLAGFEPGALIKLRLSAVNPTGESFRSEIIEVQLLPPPPEISVIENGIGADWFSIRWEPVQDAVSYQIIVNEEMVASLAAEINQHTVEGLATGTAVSVKMRAQGPAGLSEESAPLIVQLLPATPVLAVGEVSSYSATLQWSVANGASSYKVYQNTDWAIMNVPATINVVTITDNITAGMTATYTVRAVNGTGESAHSNPVVVNFTETSAIVREHGDIEYVRAFKFKFNDNLVGDISEPTMMVIFPPGLEGPSLAFEASYLSALTQMPELEKVQFVGVFTDETVTLKGKRPQRLKWKKFSAGKKMMMPGTLPMVRFYAADGILRNVIRISMAIISPYDVFKDLPELFEKSEDMQLLYGEDKNKFKLLHQEP